jgi:hypothetical protein
MPLSERSRSVLYRGLSDAIGDEGAVEEMLSHFPARDVEEVVTKEHLRAEMTVLRGEMIVFRAEVQAEFAAVRSEMAGEFSAVRSEMAEGFATVRSEQKADIADLRVELRDAMRSQTRWLVATMASFSGAIVGVVTLVS